MEEHLRFQKGHIQSDIGTSSRRVITTVAFLMSGITHKNTTKRTGIKFVTLIFVEINKSHTSKDSGCEYQNRGQGSALCKHFDSEEDERQSEVLGRFQEDVDSFVQQHHFVMVYENNSSHAYNSMFLEVSLKVIMNKFSTIV
ncbi:unnamed protein product [Prunus armeniaca]